MFLHVPHFQPTYRKTLVIGCAWRKLCFRLSCDEVRLYHDTSDRIGLGSIYYMFFHVLFVWLLASKLALSWPVSHISSVHPTLNLKFKDVFLVIGGICAARSDLGRFCNQGFGKYSTNMHQQDRRALKNGFWMVLACFEWFLHISANMPAIDFTQGSECGQPGPLLCPQELSNCWDALDRNLIDQDSFCQATRRLIEQT